MQALRPGRGTGLGVRADRLAGSIRGQALGDALGFVVEAQPPEVAQVYVQGWLRAGRAGEWSHPQFPFGQYSDDTQLARELLRSFQDAGGWDASVFAIRMAELFRDGRDVGAGQGTHSSALRLLQGVPWDQAGTPAPYAGNGAAMRAGPLGLLIPNRQAMCRVARQQARITHLDPRCAAGAAVVARAVGGDTDTMAAMAGAISGARSGAEALPGNLMARLNDRGEWRAAALVELAQGCAAIAPGS